MIKDLVVNLALAAERDPAAEFALSVASTFVAYAAGIAFHYDPIMPIAPKHMPGTGRMGRAVRWLRGITGDRSTPQKFSGSEPSAHETPVTSVSDRDRKSISILPFKNVSGDPASSFYEFSLADAVITELARVRSLTRSWRRASNTNASCRTRYRYSAQSSASAPAATATWNDVRWEYAGAIENSSAAPVSFQTPLLLLATTRKR